MSAPEFKLVEKSGESLECRAGEYASALHQLSTDYKTCGWVLTRDAALWGLKQGEEERDRLQRACAERCEQQQKLADDVRKVARERDAAQAKCEALEAERDRMRAALGKIAANGGMCMMGPTDEVCAEIYEKNDGFDCYRRAFELGSYNVYAEQAADARDALAKDCG